ncbi:uncharacterized protein LOC117317296 isoform X1 [Pecten maximus]|uniref:uncharacterized protein LOC117317296 isoform X1 n=2 Tax=Pecten maximus TaxID=6579 RepID=UPI0014587BC2|nr:uncharacterized protein LOC117317296 isoform X1 [Pecten maximus]
MGLLGRFLRSLFVYQWFKCQLQTYQKGLRLELSHGKREGPSMQYRDAYAFFVFLVFIMIIFNYKDYTERLKTTSKPFTPAKLSPLLSNITLIQRLNRSLTLVQSDRVAECITSYRNAKSSTPNEVMDSEAYLNAHSYLNSNSLIIDLGGKSAEELIKRYKPRLTVILEPVPYFYQELVKKFTGIPNVVIFNFGLASKNDVYRAKMDNHPDMSTDANRNVIVKVVNARDFFVEMGVGFFDVDLLNMDCGGCEYDVLDVILSSTLIKHFRNIEFQPHPKKSIYDSVRRYCQYEELLKDTHQNVFNQKLVKESWSRLELQK